MGKSKSESKKSKEKENEVPPSNGTVTSTIFDPTLSALFASSAGPVTDPIRVPRSVVTNESSRARKNGISRAEPQEVDADETSSSDSDRESTGGASVNDTESEEVIEAEAQRPRKRRKVDQNEDLEGKYLDKLVREEELEQKQLKTEKNSAQEDASDSDSDLNSGLEDLSDSDIEITQDKEPDSVPKHESLSSSKADVEADKISRTVFLGNVSNSVIKTKSARKALILHLQSGIDTKHHEKIESIRFRSTVFASDAGPKRAAYAKRELMEETMKSTNAYIVLSSDAAARKIATRLNGSIVLDRHLRVDNLGNPSRVDHRRCVFVGNLSFVDEATAPNDETEPNGTATKRKRAREPADVEEGLWRTFGKCGKVESVRVIRDKETRISKGFAYVQFTNENSVEAALLLNEKKFPPLLPRVLRVMRAKKEMKSRSKRRDEPSMSSKGAGRPGTKRANGRPANGSGSKVVFEGHRANSKSMPKGLKKLKKRPDSKPDNRSSKRAAAFRAGGGRKKRDIEE